MSATSSVFTSELAAELAPGLLDRFTRYARTSTQADRENPDQRPSSRGQWELLTMLEAELRELGLEDVELSATGYLFATLPATVEGTDVPVVGFMAHVDTSPDAPGDGVEPIVHRAYDGGVIALPKQGTKLDPATMPALKECLGHDLITSSGDTLLGADDKAGVAEVMSAVAHLAAHPELRRPTVRVAFTPDEEIGRGAFDFDVERFGARAAYTLDGSDPGELQAESFTAASATVTFTGVEVHPGTAYGILVNPMRLVGKLLAALPDDRLSPETTKDREGFIHPFAITGDAASATASFIVRDFEEELLAEHLAFLEARAQEVVAAQPRARMTFASAPQYPNMRDHLAPFPEVVAHAEAAIRAAGLEVQRTPIRGGTDGSILSSRGLPTPNVFTGGHEYHSVREWASLPQMADAVATIVHLAGEWSRDTA